ncbi:DUF3017 domain-containing protein [Cellulomonas humilata]|uniref:DUF3017 domain-containing protein n=1 Tax=Cellulomonas humilata TaxID=144055 RepID=A0A7Y6A1T4_9CELL|nr:DUF3017 domain-containing protein [Cellulomonas humilata]NUU18209.1 DUF3017 domain-containing protein [Cellulomonas humilata]
MSGGAGVHRAAPAHPGSAKRSEPAVPDVPDVPPARPADPTPPSTGPIPVEQAPLDPRAIARASLDAARNVSLWWTCSGIVVATLVALVVGTREGAWVLAGVALVGALVRAVLPSPGPVALSVRAKAIDVVVLVLFGTGIALLAQILPR